MTFEGAQQRIALAGRELGSGPAAAVDRLVPEVAETYFEQSRRSWERHHPSVKEQFPFNEQHVRERGELIAYGVAVGLVMAEEPMTLEILNDINREWRDRTAEGGA